MRHRSTLKTMRQIGQLAILLLCWCWSLTSWPICQGFQAHRSSSRRNENDINVQATRRLSSSEGQEPSCSTTATTRRQVLILFSAAASLFPLASYAQSTESSTTLEDLQIGQGRWTSLESTGRPASTPIIIPAPFITYLARFLIRYDDAVESWWQSQRVSVSLLSDDQQQRRLGQAFGKFAASLQVAVGSYLERHETSGYSMILQRLLETYRDEGCIRHIGILCALLPKECQPKGSVRRLLLSADFSSSLHGTPDGEISTKSSLAQLFDSSLLPDPYHIELVQPGDYVTITPSLNIYQVGLDDNFGQAATATTFGPLSSEVLTRELPLYSPLVYALFGISGATGCALTHSIVIPLDVVKTRAQTQPADYSNVWKGATKIVREEGWSGLLTGAQATLAGYFWYGLSVYPSYTFFKRYLSHDFFAIDWSVAHAGDIALMAGALASVVASLGLTPLEAARIRVVADPITYKPMGLTGTLQAIASEDVVAGWKRVYAGLPSLLLRQVIFGSVKFLAFERACDAIYTVAPSLRDATWTALTVSLVAGGFSGALSSVVSQPADAVLTYVAQNSEAEGESLGLVKAGQVMVQEGGISALFRGLGSRCIWAGSIIAGQFLLYDVFRTLFGVTPNDLSQAFQVDL